MTLSLIIGLWLVAGGLVVVATRRRLASHRELYKALEELESNYKELNSRLDKVIRSLETEVDSNDRNPGFDTRLSLLSRPLLTKRIFESICILEQEFHRDPHREWTGLPLTGKLTDLRAHMRSSDDIAQTWQDDEDYEKVVN